MADTNLDQELSDDIALGNAVNGDGPEDETSEEAEMEKVQEEAAEERKEGGYQ